MKSSKIICQLIRILIFLLFNFCMFLQLQIMGKENVWEMVDVCVGGVGPVLLHVT